MNIGSQKKKQRPIRLSTWCVYDRKTQVNYTLDKILICAEDKELDLLKMSNITMFRVYCDVYGKDKYKKKMDEGTLRVDSIIPDKKIIGHGVGCLSNDYDYYGKEAQIRQQKSNRRRN